MKISLKNISLSFSNRSTLKDLNLELAPHSFCILIGSNGSGKSSLLRTISGEYLPQEGSISLNEKDVTLWPLAKRASFVGSVSQDPSLGGVAELTLLENLILGARRGQTAPLRFYKQRATHFRALLKTLGLAGCLHKPLGTLSGGQRQLLAILMVFSSCPPVLLLDEHTSALDPAMQKEVMAYTAQGVAKHKPTTLMVTHKLDDALHYGDRLVMLHKGTVVLDVRGEDKARLTARGLLELFHTYEDRTLI